MTIKTKLIHLIVEKLKNEINTLTLSAKAAHEAATHEESKAEDSHDTRGLEASYLAGAQLARLEVLKKTVGAFQLMDVRSFRPTDPITVGALVELKIEDQKGQNIKKSLFYFLASLGGGIGIDLDGQAVQVITPLSPVGEALLGLSVGGVIEIESPRLVRHYEIVGIS